MRKKWCIALSLVLILSACTVLPDNDTSQSSNNMHATEPDDSFASTEEDPPENMDNETDADTSAEPEPPQPAHSKLYLPDYTPQQITEYFEEVVLNIEYSDGTGSEHLVQKWTEPLYYRLYGDPTDTDKEVLNAFFKQLNAVPGFPGIYAAADGVSENVSLSFLEPTVFNDSFSDVVNGEGAYGAAQFWYYTLTNELYTARIGYRTDIDQSIRNSVLPEEIINVLGISDTTLRPDSITYQYSDENTALSDIDLLILTLLYDPTIQCGMDADSCASVIQELYY